MRPDGASPIFPERSSGRDRLIRRALDRQHDHGGASVTGTCQLVTREGLVVDDRIDVVVVGQQTLGIEENAPITFCAKTCTKADVLGQ
jgi:hypothetical protein